MWELFRRDLDGMQPTLRHVPPSLPRFSIHAVYTPGIGEDISEANSSEFVTGGYGTFGYIPMAHLQTLLSSLDGSNIPSDTTTNDNKIVF